MKIRYLLLFLFAGIFSLQCNDEAGGELPPAPSSLQVTVSREATESRNISLNLSSEGTSFYKIYFGEGKNEPLITEENTISYTYGKPGFYNLRIQAHSNGIIYISETQRLNIGNVDEDEDGEGEPDGNGGEDEDEGDEWEIPATGNTSPGSYEGMRLVWQDEFEGDALNLDNWTFETGTGSNGWGNNELQYYREENTSVEDGYLIITAGKEAYEGKDYTSSRIKTQGKQAFQYGRIDIRAALPQGQGIWPALWMLGANFPTAGWPASGEIDIMEMTGGTGKDNTVHGTIHWQNEGNHANYGGDFSLEEGVFADEFHVFSIVWNPETITWYVDGEEFHVVDITPEELSEFHQEFFFIFNLAVGGNWPGSPDATTTFPQRMVVDYVRVFQEE